MPTTPLALLLGPVTPAWVAVRDVLLSDPALKRLRIDWRTPEDENFDDGPAQERILIRLTPTVTDSQREAVRFPKTVRSYTLAIEVSGDMRTVSSEWQDAANLSGAIEAALSFSTRQPADRVEHERALAEAGVFDYEMTTPVDWDQPGRISVTVWRTV